MTKIGLIGKGYWGSKILRYLPEFFQVGCVADSRTSLRSVWRNCEAVVIATPIETHYEIATQALLHGKHVFCEKPIAMHYEDAEALRFLAEKNGLKLAVEYTLTFSEGILTILQNIKRIGHVGFIEMSTKHLGRFMGPSVYWLLASHWLGVLDMFYPLKYFNCSKFSHAPETGSVLLDWMGCRARIDVSLNYPGKELRAFWYGEQGTFRYDVMATKPVRATWYRKTKGELPENLIIEQDEIYTDERHNLRNAMMYFQNVLDGKEEPNVDRAVQVTKILEHLEG